MVADERRTRFGELVQAYGNSAELSRVLGRSDGYIGRHLRDRVPYDLPDYDRRKLAQFFGVHAETLKQLPPSPSRLRWRRPRVSECRGS
ncbi:hypothetical protein [Sphingomonas xinjiangensis]|uniref:Uncharacterized protein n=1 Tax=Sphingomonas xinjiangensis TaxID=643568 RepID=A0A840YLG9_9SPHN|nr:hypothetical protein [Sphingomonas xinjiangensis]MBB5712188.1 hypothetical protein [Sphingomonas xinjiangensis]